MSIAVRCQCGQGFKAKDSLAGKTVKCPKCKQPLQIPAAAAPAAAAAQPAAPQVAQTPVMPQTQAPLPQAPAPTGGLDDLFDEIGLEQSPSGLLCPQCGSGVPVGGVLCTSCGYNMQTGEKLITQKDDEGPIRKFQSHGVEQLDKAEEDIARDADQNARINKGVPWFVYLILLMLMIGFAIGMAMLPQEMVFIITGSILFGLGVIASLLASIWVLTISWEDGTTQFILCLLCPFYMWIVILFPLPGIYCFMNWDRCSAPYFVFLGGYFAQLFGYIAIVAAPYVAMDPDEVRLPQPEPTAVVASLTPGIVQ